MISVIIPTYNPNIFRLEQTLKGLKQQSLSNEKWELIIIDNNSTSNFNSQLDLSWQKNSKIVFEPRQGLTYARLKGISEAKFDIVVMVDDDNILDSTYLENCISIFKEFPKLGAIGGKSIPLFETNPPEYINEFYSLLALRNLGEDIAIEVFDNKYPKYAPVGAGMAFRKEAIQKYIAKINDGNSVISDRKGNSLSSSGDNDMVMEIAKSGWEVGYFPQLSLQHIIPQSRITIEYLSRLNFGIQKSWVQFLLSHNISPWEQVKSWTVPFRKLKAWFTYKAWQNDINYIKWKGACGMFEGLAK